jgi:AcrR family transcriptional regulator
LALSRPIAINWTDGSTEGRIMAAALELFSRRGFQAVGIRDIAQEARLSTASLYHYMKTKEDLLLALMSDRLHRIIKAAELACADLKSPEHTLVALVQVHVIAHALFPSHVVDDELRSLSPASREAVVDLRDSYERIWDDVLERGSAGDGPFHLEDVHFARLALLGMCNGVNRWFSAEGAVPVEGVADHFADLALALVRATRDGCAVRVADLGLPPSDRYAAIVRAVYEGAPG